MIKATRTSVVFQAAARGEGSEIAARSNAGKGLHAMKPNCESRLLFIIREVIYWMSTCLSQLFRYNLWQAVFCERCLPYASS